MPRVRVRGMSRARVTVKAGSRAGSQSEYVEGHDQGMVNVQRLGSIGVRAGLIIRW